MATFGRSAASLSGAALLALLGGAAATYNRTRLDALQQVCFPDDWKSAAYTTFQDVYTFTSGKHGTVGAHCMTSVQEMAAIDIHPIGLSTWMTHTREQWQQLRNPSYCPNTTQFDEQCRQYGKVCKIAQYAGILDATGNWTSDTWTNNEVYQWSIGQWQLKAEGHTCVANLCDVAAWASESLSYLNSLHSPPSQEAISAGNAGPSEFVKVFVEVDCAAPIEGELPAMAIRLALQLNEEILSILGEERYLQDYKKDFVGDIARALSISKDLVTFVDVESVNMTVLARSSQNFLPGQNFALPGDAYVDGKVRVTFDILNPKRGLRTSTSLAEELMAQLLDPTSKLLRGTVTSKVDVEAGVMELTEDGRALTFRGGAFSAQPVDSHSAAESRVSLALGLLLLLLTVVAW